MVTERSLDKLARPHATLDFMYCLRRTRKALKVSNFDHEKACGDVFIGFARTGLLEAWEYYPKPYKYAGLEPDRAASIQGIRQKLYIEVDQGTEPLWQIEEKLNKYLSVSGEFQVVFVASTETRAEAILNLLSNFQRGNQFLVTTLEFIATDADGESFVSPLDTDHLQRLADLQ